MKHLGDICEISGAEIEPVDVIIGGSPCQDLSTAGKRAGLSGERSFLFWEQVRIIKEMRCADEKRGRTDKFVRPRYMLWENVVGAFSSNRYEDFRCVLEETVKIVQPDAVIPRPADGRWRACGCILGDGWSLAWRVCDAQFWGVAQKRRRIALVADFGGMSAPEILFERKGLLWDIGQIGEIRQEIAVEVGTGAAQTGQMPIAYTMNTRCGKKANGDKGALVQTDKSATLATANNQILFVPVGADEFVVRRLTPLECERLQGYPDGWTNIGAWVDSKGKLHKESSDTARYKAIGNSIALPPWRWILLRMTAQYYRPATLGSLFDGIGGFPLIWEQLNGKSSCRWASEIDEFCIAISKYHFGEGE